MSSTGPQFNTYEITDVSLGDTFQEWRRITNEDIIDKLNRLKLYTGISADGISVGVDVNGVFAVEHSGYVEKGVTFGGEVTILGQMTTMHSTNVTVADYNLVLGGTYESGGTGCSADSEILTAGGGGIIIARSDGPSAGWLWKPHQVGTCGHTGAWTTNENIEFGDGRGLVTGTAGNIHIGGGESCEVMILGFTASPGHTNAGGITRDHRSVSLQYDNTTLANPIDIAEISEDGFAHFYHGINKKRVTTASAHGLSFGMPVRPTGNGFTAAYAANKEQAEAVGIVSDVIDDTTFDITFQGEVRGNFDRIIDNVSSGYTLEIGKAYFLSSGATGMLSQNPPVDSQVGFVRKPMMIGMTGDTGFVVSYIGGEIAESIETGVVAQGNRLLVNQENHGFTVGDVMKFDTGITNSAQPFGTYQKAQANNEVDAETQGIISEVVTPASGSSDAFYLTNSGWVDLVDGPYTYEPGRVYFLTANTAAASASSLGLEYPRTLGMVKKPMFIATSNTRGLVLSYVGRRITTNTAPPTGPGSDSEETGSLTGKTFFPTEGQKVTKLMFKKATPTAPLPFLASGTNPSPYDPAISTYEKFRIFFSRTAESSDNTSQPHMVEYNYTNNTGAWSSISDYFTKITPPTNATHMMVKIYVKRRGIGRFEEVYAGVPNANFPNNFETTENIATQSTRDAGVESFNADTNNFTKIVPIENSNPNGQIAVSLGKPYNVDQGTPSYTDTFSVQVEVLGYFIEDGGLVVPPVVGRQGRNLIINSNFDHWQRGTDPTTLDTNFPSDGSKYDTFHADRFNAEVIPDLTSSGSVSNIIGGMSQGTFLDAQTAVPGYPKHYLNFQGYIDANFGNENKSTVSVGQRIENVRRFANKDVTISYWAKGTKTGNVRVAVVQDYQALGNTAEGNAIHVQDIGLGTDWNKFTHTVSLPAFLQGTSIGDTSFFDLKYITHSSDNNASFTSSLGATLEGFATGLTYDGILSLAQVQVEHGQQATNFQTPISEIDLEACQKYYQIAQSGWNGVVGEETADNSSIAIRGTYGNYTTFATPMRINPTCVKATSIIDGANMGSASIEDMTLGYGGVPVLTKRGFMPSRAYTGTTTLDTTYLAEYEFDAELKNNITK
jgi:hypothetical protein